MDSIQAGVNILIQFQLDHEKLWWPSKITSTKRSGSKLRGNYQVTAFVQYKKYEQYEQEEGTVLFKDSNFLIQLDNTGREIQEASWKFDDDPALGEISEDVASLSRPHSDQYRADSFSNERSQSNTSNFTNLSNTVSELLHRVSDLESQVRLQTSSAIMNLWADRCTAVRLTLKTKLLDYMKRQLIVSSKRQRHFFSHIFQHNTISFNIPCDYKLFSKLLSDLLSNGHYINKYIIDPTSLSTYIPKASTGPITIIFKSFLHMANWLGINCVADISDMILRSTSTSRNTAVSILGSTIYKSENDDDPIIVYIGHSSGGNGASSQRLLNNSTSVNVHSAAAVCMPSKTWDNVNLSFTSPFRAVHSAADVTSISDFDGKCNHFFGITWTADKQSTRSYWSADSNYNGSTILGTITAYFPSADIMGTDARIVRSIVAEYLTSSHYFN